MLYFISCSFANSGRIGERGFCSSGKGVPSVEALNGVAARVGYRPAIERHAAFAIVDVGDKDAVGFRLAGGREVVKRMGE